MQSITKIPLTEDLLRRVTRRHFDLNLRSFEELSEGFYNAAARLELEDGRWCVIKVAPPPHVSVMQYERHLMRAEVEAMRLVRAHTAVPVPGIWCYDDSHALVESEFFITEMLAGTPFHKLKPELSPDAAATVERQMGALARQISGITGGHFGYWAQPQPEGTTWRQCFERMLQGVLEDGAARGVELPLPYDTLYAALEQHFAALDEITIPRLVHWDLWDGNVFVDGATYTITGLIDFERALWADPLMEFGFLMMDANSSFVQGYGGAWFQREMEQERRMLYNAYLFLILIIECYYRMYPTRDQETWARQALTELLQRLG